VGGVIWGYRAMGSEKIARAPMSVMTMVLAPTQA
jgi:hypothetical protein